MCVLSVAFAIKKVGKIDAIVSLLILFLGNNITKFYCLPIFTLIRRFIWFCRAGNYSKHVVVFNSRATNKC